MNSFRSRLPLRKILDSFFNTTFPSKASRPYSSAAAIMKEHGVVPDVVSVAPTELLTVKFPSGASANGGNILTPTEVKDIPTISFNANSESFYLLCLSDPDSISRKRPTFREWHHWLVGNIPGSNVNEGEVLSEYISPCPPRGTGQHRYVFLVFKQSEQLSFDEPHLSNKRTTNREKFRIKKMADKYQMGNPVAGNLFIAEWDEYVDKIYADLAKL